MRPAAFACALLLAGCDLFAPGTLDVVLSADLVEAEASLLVENTGDVSAEFGPPACSAVLEVNDGGSWRDSGYEPFVICTADLVRLGPGEVYAATVPVGGLPAGVYRFRLAVGATAGDDVVMAVSNAVER